MPVTVSLTGSGTLGGTLTVATDANGRATFGDLTISGASGECTLLFASAGLQSVASSTIRVATNPNGDRSSIEAPESVAAGAPATVRVTVRDKDGGVLGGIAVTVSASGGDNTISPASAITGSNGLATFSFSSTRAETKSLSAEAGGVSIGPVSMEITPAEPDAGHTTAQVPDGRSFRTTRITVEAHDRYDNRVRTGGATVAASVAGTNAGLSSVTVRDNEDGTYTLSYSPLFKGTDTITISLNGSQISGSPYTSQVK